MGSELRSQAVAPALLSKVIHRVGHCITDEAHHLTNGSDQSKLQLHPDSPGLLHLGVYSSGSGCLSDLVGAYASPTRDGGAWQDRRNLNSPASFTSPAKPGLTAFLSAIRAHQSSRAALLAVGHNSRSLRSARARPPTAIIARTRHHAFSLVGPHTTARMARSAARRWILSSSRSKLCACDSIGGRARRAKCSRASAVSRLRTVTCGSSTNDFRCN